MPPDNADPHVGKFTGDMNMSTQDQNRWCTGSRLAPARRRRRPPLKLNAKPAPEWKLGTPDLVDRTAGLHGSGVWRGRLPESGREELDAEGCWLRAATVKPSDRAAVHHLLSNGGVGGYDRRLPRSPRARRGRLWVTPGQDFKFQMHYTPDGKQTVEKTRVGLTSTEGCTA